jgi:hypothetical protein
VEYTFLSAAHGTFFKINYIWGHKASLNKYKKIEITPYILSDHNRIKPELSNKRNFSKYFKQMETEQYTVEGPLGHWSNRGGWTKKSSNENTTTRA